MAETRFILTLRN